jgi:DNA mismatch repair protein MutL
MGNIKVLSEEVANRIAAGEVVERPVSVIKELVENSIDAKASKITVIIENGGKKLMQVADNGEGMSEDDAMQCFERHLIGFQGRSPAQYSFCKPAYAAY